MLIYPSKGELLPSPLSFSALAFTLYHFQIIPFHSFMILHLTNSHVILHPQNLSPFPL